jgi:alcohol dehydrogenase
LFWVTLREKWGGSEYVLVPHADTSLYHIPGDIDEEEDVLLSDIFPTSYECGVINGKIQPGGTVAIVGAGPIGLAALLTAQLYSPAEIIVIDGNNSRLEMAQRLGATATINNSDSEPIEKLMQLTQGRGTDTVIEAVGVPASFQLCEELVAPGGIIANIGVHGTKVDLHLERLWDRNVTITTRLVDTVSTSTLLKIMHSGKLQPRCLITHRFKLEQILDAYKTFEHAADTHALKVIIDT